MNRFLSELLICISLLSLFSTHLSAQWIGPSGGNIVSMDIDGSTIYAAAEKRAFRSTDNGNTWTNITFPVTCEYISDIDIAGNTIILRFTTHHCGGDNLLLSSDGGITWGTVPVLPKKSIKDVFTNGSSIYVLADLLYTSTDNGVTWSSKSYPEFDKLSNHGSSLIGYSINKGIYISTDATNWTSINDGLNSTMVRAFSSNGSTMIAGVAGKGIYISTNNGTSWSLKSNGITNTYIRTTLINGNNFYAGSEDGLFHSSDGGNSWIELTNGPSGMANDLLELTYSTILVGNREGIFKTDSNGTSWQEANTGLKATKVRKLVVNDNTIYAATLSGFYISSNAGTTWIKKHNTDIGTLDLVYHNNALYGIGINGILSKSTDDGENWASLYPDAYVTSIHFTDNAMYATSNSYALYRSTDFGENWTKIHNKITWGMTHNDTYIFASGNGYVFRSSDDGDNWTTLTDIPTENSIHTIYADGNTIYAGSGYVSKDNGDTWSRNSEIGDKLLIVDNPPNSDFQRFMFASSHGGFSISYDNGNTWHTNKEYIVEKYYLGVNAFASIDGYLYLATEGLGIYKRPLPASPSITSTIPSINACYDKETKETYPFLTSDAYTPENQLTYTISSDNQSILPSVKIEENEDNRMLNINSQNWATGSTDITVTAENYDGLTASKTFTYSVYKNETIPTISLQELPNNTLVCSTTGSSYEWSLNGQVIQGVSSQNLEITTDGYYYVRMIDTNGCYSSYSPKFTFSTVTSTTTKNLFSSGFRYYPNPVHHTLFVDWDNEIEIQRIRILNSYGAEVYQQSTSGHNALQIPLGNHEAGLYFLEVSYNHDVIVQKVLIK